MGKQKGIVMDGRDIGTVVFPDAELKMFMTASIVVRTERRVLELREKGITDLNYRVIENNLLERDRIDSTRLDSPLTKAEDAIEIDNSNLSVEDQLELALELVEQVVSKKR
jgi:cytidylate kinase